MGAAASWNKRHFPSDGCWHWRSCLAGCFLPWSMGFGPLGHCSEAISPFFIWCLMRFWLASLVGLCQPSPSLPCLFAFYQSVAYQNFASRSNLTASVGDGDCAKSWLFISQENPLPKIRFILSLSLICFQQEHCKYIYILRSFFGSGKHFICLRMRCLNAFASLFLIIKYGYLLKKSFVSKWNVRFFLLENIKEKVFRRFIFFFLGLLSNKPINVSLPLVSVHCNTSLGSGQIPSGFWCWLEIGEVHAPVRG